MIPASVYKSKAIIAENATSFRKPDGKVVYRKEKIFDDGSRLVEESFFDDNDADVEAVPFVAANVVGQNQPQQSQKGGKPGMLQPMYDPNGKPWVIAILILIFYVLPIILLIVFWVRRVRRTVDVVTTVSSGGYSDYWNSGYYSSAGESLASYNLLMVLLALLSLWLV